jgi:hypothetical protein
MFQNESTDRVKDNREEALGSYAIVDLRAVEDVRTG